MLLGLIALTLPLCFDSFLVAAAIGTTHPPFRTRLKLSALLAAFESGMPLIGLALGSALAKGFGGAAQYIAIVILLGYGTYAGLKSRAEDDTAERLAAVHGLTMLALGLSISLDGLAIGFSYGLLKVPVIAATVAIIIQAFALMELGFAVGSLLPDSLRRWGEKLANWVLVLIGLVLLVEKLI